MHQRAIIWAGLLLLAFTAGAGAAPREGPPFPRIANCYGVGLGPESTPDDLKEIARFDLLIGGIRCNWADAGQRAKLAANIAAARKLNPHLLLLDFSSSAPYADPKDVGFPAGGWLLQPDDRRIQGWPGTEMIDLPRPEVLDWLAGRSVASVREKGLDGTFIDCMGPGFDSWACNIAGQEPYQVDADRDGKPDERAALDRAWTAAKIELSRRVREAVGPTAPFMTNQAGEWGLPYMNGILLEDYLDYVLDGRMGWEGVLRTYLQWTQAPHRPNVTTLVSSSGLEPPFDPWRTMATPERNALLERGRSRLERMRFGLTTTLMGDGYFAYDLHTRWRGQRWWYPEYDAPLGYPKGPAAGQPDGTWRREFDGGTVVVNPTPFDVRLRFPSRRRDASSGKVGTEFVIPSRDGRILLPTQDAPAAGSLPDPNPLLTFAGPERVVEHAERVLCRLAGAAALFDREGRLLSLTDGTRILLEGMRAFAVTDDHWRDFAYEGCRHERLPDGRLIFTGKRTDGGATLSYREEVQVLAKELVLTYEWEALSPAHLHMFREQADLPVSTWAGGRFQAGTAAGVLPAERAPAPELAGPLRELILSLPKGPALSVSVSGEARLVDERHYNVQGYRLGLHPARGDMKPGERWGCVLHIRLAGGR